MKEYNPQFFDFIHKNSQKDPGSLLLAHKKETLPFDLSFAVTQIECRQRFNKKFPGFLKNSEFIFPAKISGEQASDESVAHFHSSFLNSEDEVLDMTGGLGVDSLTMADSCRQVTVCEIDEAKYRALLHNKSVLEKGNVSILNIDSIEFLKEKGKKYDVIFVDPSRRDGFGKRVFRLADSSPDIIGNLDLIVSSCHRLYVKASPLIDFSQTIKEIPYLKEFIVVMAKGECKEVMIVAGEEFNKKENTVVEDRSKMDQSGREIICRVVELDEKGNPEKSLEYVCNHNILSSGNNLQGNSPIPFLQSSEEIKPGQFLYEPNAGVMKLAPWNILAERYEGLKKFAPSSHLFIAKEFYPEFQGRISKIINILDKKSRNSLKGTPATVVSRNHPSSADAIRNELKLKEGDNDFIYASKIGKKNLMILCSLIRQ